MKVAMRKGQLWVDMEIIGRLVAAALPATDPLCRLFEPISGGDGDFIEPTMDQLLLAHDAFYGLPGAEQRRILNGWSPYPDRDGLFQQDSSRDYFRVLHIGTPDGQGVPAGHCVEPIDGMRPVHVFIREGATKAETLGALERIAARLADHWDIMIDHRRLEPDESAEPAPALAC